MQTVRQTLRAERVFHTKVWKTRVARSLQSPRISKLPVGNRHIVTHSVRQNFLLQAHMSTTAPVLEDAATQGAEEEEETRGTVNVAREVEV